MNDKKVLNFFHFVSVNLRVSVVICLLLFACSEEKKAGIPSHILPKQKMADVMLEVHLLEAAMSLNTYRTDMVTNGNPTPTFDVFDKNKITKDQYNKSFEYYAQHPELLNEVYQLVLENLSKMQAEVMNKKEMEKVKKDTAKITPQRIDKKFNTIKKKIK